MADILSIFNDGALQFTWCCVLLCRFKLFNKHYFKKI